jgi:cytochrome b subunit of formate dehydrogenase
MLTGRVPRRWADDHHPLWADEVTAASADDGADPGARVGDAPDRPLR